MTKVAVVAEHALLAEALATRIDAEDELSVVGTATDGAAATKLALRQAIDVIVLDIDLPHEDGVALGRRLHEIRPGAHLIVLSGRWDPMQAARALDYGVRGWVQKSGPVDELLHVIRAALRDETRIPPRLLTEVLAWLTPAPDVTWATLTRRERQVFAYLAQGLSPAHIAARLQLSGGTVRSHVRNVLVKLGAQSAEQAVALQLAGAAHPRERANGQPADQPARPGSLFGSDQQL
ncbi:MAG: response regulator [Frankiaceae bacterium]